LFKNLDAYAPCIVTSITDESLNYRELVDILGIKKEEILSKREIYF